jgi:metallopeptidase MepB
MSAFIPGIRDSPPSSPGQLYFGLFDMKCHTSPDDQDYTKLWNELREDIALTSIGNAGLPEGQGSFAHLAGGYEA